METKAPDIGLEVEPHGRIGRYPSPEPYRRVTVILYERHVLWLDRLALTIRERTGKYVYRAELVRALVEQAARSLNPEAKDFERTVRRLLNLDGKRS